MESNIQELKAAITRHAELIEKRYNRKILNYVLFGFMGILAAFYCVTWLVKGEEALSPSTLTNLNVILIVVVLLYFIFEIVFDIKIINHGRKIVNYLGQIVNLPDCCKGGVEYEIYIPSENIREKIPDIICRESRLTTHKGQVWTYILFKEYVKVSPRKK